MNDGFAFFDIIIFAMLAIYLVFQLRRALGRKTGTEKPPTNEFTEEKEPISQQENIIDGDPDIIESLTDLWTFNRDVTSPNPNWILTRTETPTES